MKKSVKNSRSKNPYGYGGSSKKIALILERIKFEKIINKKFFDII